jgi:lysozyme
MDDDQHIGPDGREICHYFEQCKLRAYPDPGSPLFKALKGAGIDPYSLATVPQAYAHLSGKPWTIGWGDTGPDVVPGLLIDQQEADRRFDSRMANEFEEYVRRYVTVPLTQKQLDAMASIFYNVGPGGSNRDGIARLASGSPSTLLRKLNAGDYEGAAAQFPSWNKSGGAVMKGLQRRREAERLVFLGQDAGRAIQAALARFP